MPVNLQLIQQEFEAAGIFNVWADYNGNLTWDEANPPTQQQINTATALVAAHNSAAATTKQQASSAYAASGASNAGRLKYFMYFVHLQDVCLAHITNQTTEATRFSETLAALKQSKASNPDHAFMFQRFLYETGVKNGVANMTESILDNLTVTQRRTFYNEVQVFYVQGLLAGLSVLLKNGS